MKTCDCALSAFDISWTSVLMGLQFTTVATPEWSLDASLLRYIFLKEVKAKDISVQETMDLEAGFYRFPVFVTVMFCLLKDLWVL